MLCTFEFCYSQTTTLEWTFPTKSWNHSQFVGGSTHLVSSLFQQIPTRIFENEYTGVENATNAMYRTALLAGIVVPIATVIATGNSAISYHLQESPSHFHFQNPYQFWDNSVSISPQTIPASLTEIHRNFQVSMGYNASILLRNSVSKHSIHFNNSSILESATIVATAISQLRPFFNDNTFAGSQLYTKSIRFEQKDSIVSEKQFKNFQSISTINFLNPLVWSSLYHILVGYPLKGKSFQQTPFIRLTKTVTYLPFFDVFLAPYGAEVQMTNVFSNQNNLQTIIQFRLASTTNNNPFSVGIEFNDWKISENIIGAGSVEFWNQPKDNIENDGEIGGQCMATIAYELIPVFDKTTLGICGGMGYKTYGFSSIPNLQESFFVNVGLSIRNLR